MKKPVNPYALLMFNFIPKKILDYNIYSLGKPGELGFGIAAVPEDILPDGFVGMNGWDDLRSENYGNYTDSDGSIMCWIPKFYYKCEGFNVFFKDNETFANKEEALKENYVLHRAFVDGGLEKKGFFIDKYAVSKKNNGKTLISLPKQIITHTFIKNSKLNRSNEGCLIDVNDEPLNFPHWFVDLLQKYRGTTYDQGYNVASIFAMGAVRMLSITHGACAVTNNNCAWLDIDYNFNTPYSAIFVRTISNGDYLFTDNVDRKLKPFMGYFKKDNVIQPYYSGNIDPIELSTHNGQKNGICDLSFYYDNEFNIGVDKGHNGYQYNTGEWTDNGNLYFYKPELKISDCDMNVLDVDLRVDSTNQKYFNIEKYNIPDSSVNYLIRGYGYNSNNGNVFSNNSTGFLWEKTGFLAPLRRLGSLENQEQKLNSSKYLGKLYFDLPCITNRYLNISKSGDGSTVVQLTSKQLPSDWGMYARGMFYPD